MRKLFEKVAEIFINEGGNKKQETGLRKELYKIYAGMLKKIKPEMTRDELYGSLMKSFMKAMPFFADYAFPKKRTLERRGDEILAASVGHGDESVLRQKLALLHPTLAQRIAAIPK